MADSQNLTLVEDETDFAKVVSLVFVPGNGHEPVTVMSFYRQTKCTCGAVDPDDPEDWGTNFNCVCPHDWLPRSVQEAIDLMWTRRRLDEVLNIFMNHRGDGLVRALKAAASRYPVQEVA